MKHIGAIILTIALAVLCLIGTAMAETDPIVANMELSPSKLTGPGTVTVTITISNSGDTDMKDPVVLYDPAAQLVSDFGNNGSAILKAGESKTWTGKYDVNQRTLENGSVVYYIKYTLYKDSGEAVATSQPIRAKLTKQTANTDIEVKRTISPSVAQEGQEIVVRYDITNTGTVSLLKIGIQENSDIYKKKVEIPELKPGQTAQIPYKVTMGKKDLTSNATITYTSEQLSKPKTYNVDKAVIRFGKASLSAKLSSSAKGVASNGTVTLKLEIKNEGSVDYTDLRVTETTLGDVFSNQEIKAGKTLTLEKEITIPATTTYQFNVLGTDETGLETSILTNDVTITAVNPEDALHLDIIATPDRTEVFETPGAVRFTLTITNDSHVDAKNVAVSHGSTKLYTFDSIPAGQTCTMSRDTLLSMAGKYVFTVTALDPLETTQTFNSNEIRIAFSLPTTAPATPTPIPEPTPEPTFSPATIPPIYDSNIAPTMKLINKIAFPVAAASGVLLAAGLILLGIALIRKGQQKKASDAAVDTLQRIERRDYEAEVEGDKPVKEKTNGKKSKKAEKGNEETKQNETESSIMEDPSFEPPHVKYARSAAQQAALQRDPIEENAAPLETATPSDPFAPYDAKPAAVQETAPVYTPGMDDSAFRRPTANSEESQSEENKPEELPRRRSRRN